MAVDKLVDSAQLDTDLTAVANAIRTKGGTSASLAFPAGFVSAVEAIPTGGGGGDSGIDLFPLPDGYSLPSNYQKLLYADSSCAQYCDTGVHPTLETKLEIAGYFISGTFGEYKYLSGCTNPLISLSSNNYTGARVYFGFGNKSDFFSPLIGSPGVPIFSIDKTEGKVQNAQFPDQSGTCGATTMSGSTGTIVIFGRRDGNNVNRLSPMRFFRERIWENGTLIRCIFPVLKDGNEVGLYDVITGTYLPNMGTAPLVGGVSL